MGKIRKTTGFVARVCLLIGWLAVGTAHATTLYGPTQYLSFSDSPFSIGSSKASYFYLEDFEDGLLNTPGVSFNKGIVGGPSYNTDSVDYGQGGHSYYSNGSLSLDFIFDAKVLGFLPNQAGIVWTDVGYGGGYYGTVTFSAYGADNSSLGTISAYLGDGVSIGTTGEDRFFGVFNQDGVSKITISMTNSDWEVDHLQYGSAVPSPVPEPAAIWLFGSGLLWFIGIRKKIRTRRNK